jgi:DNA-directed RNA polymerase subunit F
MIISKEPLSMAEAFKHIKEDESSETDIVGFIKKFIKIKKGHAEKLRKTLQALELMKVKNEHIAKIIDLVPETKEELNKIFVDVSLDEDESQKIINTIKESK